MNALDRHKTKLKQLSATRTHPQPHSLRVSESVTAQDVGNLSSTEETQDNPMFGSAVVPPSFRDLMEPYGHRFIHVAKTGKSAVDREWPGNPLSLEQLKPWFSEGGNYGVVAGQGLIIIDLDDPRFEADLPETLTVETGRGGLHLYYRSDACDNGILDQDGKNLGHIQVKRKYVVGPGSIHPNGSQYKVQKALPIAWIGKTKLEEAFGSLLRWAGVEKHVLQAEREHRESGIRICDVALTPELEKKGNEYQGRTRCMGARRARTSV